ncbi:MAG TPA: multiheme c-type cytochrome [Polyangium sp.]|nr:multiheme c-type cytochrome [Polyangium sp.]
MFALRFHLLCLVVAAPCACSRVDSGEGQTQEISVFVASDELPLPGPNRARLENAVKENASCMVCHDEQAHEWRGSLHQRANVDPAYRQAFAIEPLPFCRGCHAPEADPRDEPPASVSELGVGCVTCHVTREGVVWAAPATNPSSAPHAVHRSEAFAMTGGCTNCHEFGFPGTNAGPHDGDAMFMQTTGREHARSAAAKTPCADCHMPVVLGRRSHHFREVRDSEWLRKNLEVTVRKGAADSVEVVLRQTRPGHAFPTGDLFRRLEVGAELRDTRGNVLRRDVQHLSRQFIERPHMSGRDLQGDERLFDAPRTIDLDIAPESKVAEPLRVFHWVKLQRVATVGSGFSALEAVVESEVELHSGVFSWSP